MFIHEQGIRIHCSTHTLEVRGRRHLPHKPGCKFVNPQRIHADAEMAEEVVVVLVVMDVVEVVEVVEVSSIVLLGWREV